jgi:hypothetical protein
MRILLLSFLAVSTATLSSAVDAPSITGNWKIHTSISGNESDIACALTQKEDVISGKCTSDRGEIEMTGKATGQKISMSYKSEYNGTPLTVVYEGTLDEAAGIKGSVNVPEFGVGGDFTATKSK